MIKIIINSLELEKKSYQECIKSLPRNKDCKVASIQFVIVEDK